jgi:hypothetical protein
MGGHKVGGTPKKTTKTLAKGGKMALNGVGSGGAILHSPLGTPPRAETNQVERSCKCGSPRARSSAGRLYPYCLPCKRANERSWQLRNPEKWARMVRKSRLKYEYGISIEEYDELLVSQDGKCAICRRDVVALVNGRPDQACLDHDHLTGQIRGILCSECNAALGLFHDDNEVLAAAIFYLR